MKKPTLRLILGDQLSMQLPTLHDANPATDRVMLCEVWEEATYVKHHKKKIAFLFSAMRHFAKELEDAGFHVSYTQLDDPKNTGSFFGEVQRQLQLHPHLQRVVLTQPSEYRVWQEVQTWEARLGLSVEQREDTRFLCSIAEFAAWAKGRKQLRMEYFYRLLRVKHNILMDGDAPIGGQWNYDSENRQAPKEGLAIPAPYRVEPDASTQAVLALVAERFASHFGDLEPFYFAVTRTQALEVLALFIRQRLPHFGQYQDAMIQGQPWMYHSHISFYLNCGLLSPLECIQQAEAAYHRGDAPLNAVEGFVRQILGWREYVRGLYWLTMPAYAEANALEAHRPLPALYWGEDTRMNCLKQCVKETQQHAYAHHIQRLMVLGNFALLAGVHPKEVNEWFLIVYADAFEWVELPNVSGMVLHADGGYLASKPYAAGGSYIQKMSNYCKACEYKVSVKEGPTACPFNYLYWNFLAQHRPRFEKNPRMAMMYKTYDKMGAEKQALLASQAETFLQNLL